MTGRHSHVTLTAEAPYHLLVGVSTHDGAWSSSNLPITVDLTGSMWPESGDPLHVTVEMQKLLLHIILQPDSEWAASLILSEIIDAAVASVHDHAPCHSEQQAMQNKESAAGAGADHSAAQSHEDHAQAQCVVREERHENVRGTEGHGAVGGEWR